MRYLTADHDPAPHTWECRACPAGTAWPCLPAKESMLKEMTSTELALHQWASFTSAVVDFTEQGKTLIWADAYARFFSWSRRGPLG
jgi:hypothetical protein